MTIEAMKQEVEALLKEVDGGWSPAAKQAAWRLQFFINQAIAEAEKQEPVAWGFQNTAITGSNRWMLLREEVPANDQYGGALWTPLYTPPQPKREWVGLTDDELSEFDIDPVEAKALIQKLKEKNT